MLEEVGLLFYSKKGIEDPQFGTELVACKARFLKRMGYTPNVIYVKGC